MDGLIDAKNRNWIPDDIVKIMTKKMFWKFGGIYNDASKSFENRRNNWNTLTNDSYELIQTFDSKDKQ